MKRKLTVSASTPAMAGKLKQKGADECVFALEGFSAGPLAKHTLDELKELDSFGVFVSRSFYEEDLASLQALLQELSGTRVSSVYFSDPAVLQLSGTLKNHLIYRPETLAVSPQDISWWLSQGIASVSVSPLLTKEELFSIIRQCPGCEVSVHGHTMMSMSRRRLLSAYRQYGTPDFQADENTRLTLREEKRDYHMPVYEDACGTMIHTDYVQESFTIFKGLLEAGMTRCFVDPVYLSEDEALQAVMIYRGLLDGKDMTEEIRAYETAYGAHLSEGYYGQKTIL